MQKEPSKEEERKITEGKKRDQVKGKGKGFYGQELPSEGKNREQVKVKGKGFYGQEPPSEGKQREQVKVKGKVSYSRSLQVENLLPQNVG